MRYLRHDLVLSGTQKKIMKLLMVEELNLYNTLNESLSRELKNNHEGFLEIIRNLRLYGECVEHNISVRGMGDDIPPQLDDLKEQLVFLSEGALKILDTALVKTNISPRTKRNMGVQLYRYYADQSKNYGPNGQLVQPIMSLPFHTIDIKRHVQLHRKAIAVDYNEEHDVSVVKTPYTKGLIVKGNIKRKAWSIMVIHQTPFTKVDVNTPWCVDLQETKEDYMLQFIDNNEDRNVYNNKHDHHRVNF